jgi:hypothetical protein
MNFKSLPYFRRVKWNPDRAELRRFAIAMPAGFALLGVIGILKNHGVTHGILVLWGIGLGVALAAWVPGLGRIVYLAIYLPSSFVGHFVSKVVLFLVFFLVFFPVGALLHLLGKDLLRLRPGKPRATWNSMKSVNDSRRYYRQF